VTNPYLKLSRPYCVITGAAVAVVFWDTLFVFYYRIMFGSVDQPFPIYTVLWVTIVALAHGLLTGLAIGYLDLGRFSGGIASLVAYYVLGLITALIGGIYQYNAEPYNQTQGFQLFFGQYLSMVVMYWIISSIWTFIPTFLIGLVTSAIASIAEDKKYGRL
jgi:hypothetical protein